MVWTLEWSGQDSERYGVDDMTDLPMQSLENMSRRYRYDHELNELQEISLKSDFPDKDV
jgi:hypothetical protein